MAAALADPHMDRVKFVSLDVRTEDEDVEHATVVLEHPDGSRFSGDFSGSVRHQVIASAAVEALRQAISADGDKLDLLGVRAVRAFSSNVVVVALAVKEEEGVRRLVGSCLTEHGVDRAVALAVLNATNRYLGRSGYLG